MVLGKTVHILNWLSILYRSLVSAKSTVVWEKFGVKNFGHWCDMTKIERMKYF